MISRWNCKIKINKYFDLDNDNGNDMYFTSDFLNVYLCINNFIERTRKFNNF